MVGQPARTGMSGLILGAEGDRNHHLGFRQRRAHHDHDLEVATKFRGEEHNIFGPPQLTNDLKAHRSSDYSSGSRSEEFVWGLELNEISRIC